MARAGRRARQQGRQASAGKKEAKNANQRRRAKKELDLRALVVSQAKNPSIARMKDPISKTVRISTVCSDKIIDSFNLPRHERLAKSLATLWIKTRALKSRAEFGQEVYPATIIKFLDGNIDAIRTFEKIHLPQLPAKVRPFFKRIIENYIRLTQLDIWFHGIPATQKIPISKGQLTSIEDMLGFSGALLATVLKQSGESHDKAYRAKMGQVFQQLRGII